MRTHLPRTLGARVFAGIVKMHQIGSANDPETFALVVYYRYTGKMMRVEDSFDACDGIVKRHRYDIFLDQGGYLFFHQQCLALAPEMREQQQQAGNDG